MKKLVIVSTEIDGGMGGISTALQGYRNGLNIHDVDIIPVSSHREDRKVLRNWLSAFWQVAKLAYRYRGGEAVFWFHLGPWLSSARKFTMAVVARLFGCMTLGHVHSPTYNDDLEAGGIRKALLKMGLSPYSKLVVLTPWWKKRLNEHGINKPMIVSANPSCEEYTNIAREFSNVPLPAHSTDSLTIVTMARLMKGKGVELVIEAMTKLPANFNLIVAGDGPFKDELMAMTKSLELEQRVSFAGWIDGQQKEQLLRDADIFCLPSTYESFGMVFIEAMAFNLPVVAYGWGPIKDVVTPDVGVACEHATAQDVEQALITIGNQLPVYHGCGPKRVLDFYTAEAVTKNIIELLE